MTYAPPQWPRPRKGYQLTHISFRPDGSVRSAEWTPTGRSRLNRDADAEAKVSPRGVVRETLFD